MTGDQHTDRIGSEAGTDVPEGFLEGLSVLEWGEMVAAPYSAKLLADLGADVVKVESPDGDRARRVGPFIDDRHSEDTSILFMHLNTSKRGVRVDAGSADGRRRMGELVGQVDLFITDRSPAELAANHLDPAALVRDHPNLVVLWMTPFGTSGPYKDFEATPLTTFHGAGEGYLTPVASHLKPDTATLPPLRQGRFAAEYKLATYAATLAMAGVIHARASGIGQVIDLSKQDALIGLNFFEFQGWLSEGEVPTRTSLAVPFGGIMRCQDGYLQFTFHEEHQWRALVHLMGDPEWAQQEWAQSEETRLLHTGEINARLDEFLSTLTRDQLVKTGQAAGVTVAPYHAIDEVVGSDQIIERGYLHEVSHPVAGTYRYPTGPWRFSGQGPRPGPAPRLGQHDGEVFGKAPRSSGTARATRVPSRSPTLGEAAPAAARTGALSGTRVLDFTWAVAGPMATMTLASLGAEVIKVETSLRLDVLRRSAFTGSTTNRQKKAITLNLRHEKAVALAKRLVAQCDVVAESFRPGVMDGLGLGYPALKSVKEDIIMLSSSMAGQRGPYARFAGYAPMFVALSGLGDMTGYEDGPPTQIRVGGDIIVGVHGGFALVAALAHHQATGQGTHIDLSSIEAQSNLIGDSILAYTATGTVPSRTGNDEPGQAPHNCYRCRGEESWVSIAVEDDGQWEAMASAMGHPPWSKDPRFATGWSRWEQRRELDDLVGQWTADRSAAQVTQTLQAAGVAAMPSFRANDLFADPHVVSRDLLTTVDGAGARWPLIRLGGRLSATPLILDRAGPAMGEDNDTIFKELLGLSGKEVAGLEEEGVFT